MSLETMTKLSSTTVGVGGAATVTFSNIPQGYTDLKILISARNTAANYGGFYMRFNSSSSSYTACRIKGEGATASSDTSIEIPLEQSNWTASTFGNAEIYISNYAGSTYKSALIDAVTENNGTDNRNTLNAWLWSNSSPVTSISFGTFDTGASDSFAQNSTFTLYGIKNAAKTAGNSIKATGGNIVFDGTYVYHVFSSTGAFVATQPLTVDYLVVAGGGGGSFYNGGGGGAGGLRSTLDATGGGGTVESKLSLAPASYAVTIGAGGVAGLYSGLTSAGSGSDSLFSTITSTGGGRAGSTYATPTGGNGGSGGGGGNGGDTSASGGTGTTNQGYAGGAKSGPNDAGAGGGGAGAIGTARTNASDGQGGVGVYLASFSLATGAGVSGYFAGGGGGGFANANGVLTSGGLGGGGNGGRNTGSVAPTAGTANTGGGGGGTGLSGGDGAAGGSGIVIVRYKG